MCGRRYVRRTYCGVVGLEVQLCGVDLPLHALQAVLELELPASIHRCVFENIMYTSLTLSLAMDLPQQTTLT